MLFVVFSMPPPGHFRFTVDLCGRFVFYQPEVSVSMLLLTVARCDGVCSAFVSATFCRRRSSTFLLLVPCASCDAAVSQYRASLSSHETNDNETINTTYLFHTTLASLAQLAVVASKRVLPSRAMSKISGPLR